jgi:hypothetical protein
LFQVLMPVEAEPGQILDDGGGVFRAAAARVDILEPEQEPPPGLARDPGDYPQAVTAARIAPARSPRRPRPAVADRDPDAASPERGGDGDAQRAVLERVREQVVERPLELAGVGQNPGVANLAPDRERASAGGGDPAPPLGGGVDERGGEDRMRGRRASPRPAGQPALISDPSSGSIDQPSTRR